MMNPISQFFECPNCGRELVAELYSMMGIKFKAPLEVYYSKVNGTTSIRVCCNAVCLSGYVDELISTATKTAED